MLDDNINERWFRLLAESDCDEMEKMIGIHGKEVVDAINGDSNAALHLAVQSGKKDIVQFLLINGADTEAQDVKKRTALSLAIYSGNKGMVELLLSYGAGLEARDWRQRTPLLTAVWAGNAEIVALLLANNADVNARDWLKKTSLHVAVWTDNVKVVECLLKQNEVNVDVQDKYGMTPLHSAAEYGYLGIVNLLLRRDIDLNIKDDEGKTALKVARENGRYLILIIMIVNIAIRPIWKKLKGFFASEAEDKPNSSIQVISNNQFGGYDKGVKLTVGKGIEHEFVDDLKKNPTTIATDPSIEQADLKKSPTTTPDFSSIEQVSRQSQRTK